MVEILFQPLSHESNIGFAACSLGGATVVDRTSDVRVVVTRAYNRKGVDDFATLCCTVTS